MDNAFGAEYLDQIEVPTYGSKGTVMCHTGECWEGTIVCPLVGPCYFVKEKYLGG